MIKLKRTEVTAIALEAGFMLSTAYGQELHQQMPVSDTKTIVKLLELYEERRTAKMDKIMCPCIVVKENKNPGDFRPHGQIAALYPTNVKQLWGEDCLEKMLAFFDAGTGDKYEYIITEIEQNTAIIKEFEELPGMPMLFHPEYYREKE